MSRTLQARVEASAVVDDQQYDVACADLEFEPLGGEAILICAMPTAVVPVMFALRYKTYQTEAASTLLLTTLAMIVVTPVAITLTGS